jgi:predicted GIY-YIG superfamily endonuclease
MVYLEAFETRQEAMRREARIKRMNRGQKLALIAGESGRERKNGRDEEK